MRKDHLLLLGHKEKKSQKSHVVLLSTDSQAESHEKITVRRGKEIRISKPKVILNYNSFMGGIDGNDMMLYCYLDERRTVKYWKKVVFNIFGRLVLNAYILYKEKCMNSNCNRPMSRLQFTVKIVESLSDEWLSKKANRQDVTRQPSKRIDTPKIEKLPGRQERNCCVCSAASTQAGGKRKKSRSICIKCKRGLHPFCVPQHLC